MDNSEKGIGENYKEQFAAEIDRLAKEEGRENISLELIETPDQLLALVEATLEERLQQTVTSVVGFRIISKTDDPRFKTKVEMAEAQIDPLLKKLSEETTALQSVTKYGLNKLVPVDRTNKQRPVVALDVVSKVPFPEQKGK